MLQRFLKTLFEEERGRKKGEKSAAVLSDGSVVSLRERGLEGEKRREKEKKGGKKEKGGGKRKEVNFAIVFEFMGGLQRTNEKKGQTPPSTPGGERKNEREKGNHILVLLSRVTKGGH